MSRNPQSSKETENQSPLPHKWNNGFWFGLKPIGRISMFFITIFLVPHVTRGVSEWATLSYHTNLTLSLRYLQLENGVLKKYCFLSNQAKNISKLAFKNTRITSFHYFTYWIVDAFLDQLMAAIYYWFSTFHSSHVRNLKGFLEKLFLLAVILIQQKINKFVASYFLKQWCVKTKNITKTGCKT